MLKSERIIKMKKENIEIDIKNLTSSQQQVILFFITISLFKAFQESYFHPEQLKK